MKLVEFTREMRPYVKGEQCAVPNELADQLVANGEAVVVPSVFDQRPPEPVVRDRRPASPRRRYQTR